MVLSGGTEAQKDMSLPAPQAPVGCWEVTLVHSDLSFPPTLSRGLFLWGPLTQPHVTGS